MTEKRMASRSCLVSVALSEMTIELEEKSAGGPQET